ncbi:MAG: methyl-accepting chemotaxis protein, partial [Calditrichia bacterium]
TGEISEMIGKTQKAAGQVVQIIRNGNDEMQQGLKLSQQASDALQSSVEGANDVQVKMAQIATSSDQQSAALTDISRNVESISNITSESATALSDISQTISDLSRVINQLHSSVQQFKLSKSDLMINSFAENERFN